ncbi:MAG: DUF4468 domain-containing protein [Dysgonamonadaceae bacterium]|jgi:hypothetical protein|nr:DUF4468 domain-containing protein [Dysgonamonadaceae bacterium]
MKRYILWLSILGLFSFKGFAQVDNIFSSVPVVNGKVVFQQFIHADPNLSDDQKYAILSQWGKDHFPSGASLLSIRFDEKNKSLTVNAKTNLSLPQNKANASKVAMTYRFDASIANMGCMLVIRDISYQLPNGDPVKPAMAESVITDSAISSASGNDRDLNNAVRKSTLLFFNQLYSKLNQVFE